MTKKVFKLIGGSWDGKQMEIDEKHTILQIVQKSEYHLGSLQQSGDFEIYRRKDDETFVFSSFRERIKI